MNRAESDILDQRLRRLSAWKCLLAVTAVAQLMASFRLWTPQDEFPQTPILSDFIWPNTIAWSLPVLLLSALGSLFMETLLGRERAWPKILFLLTAGALILEDQHRMQPWLIHEMWLFGLMLAGGTRRMMSLTVALTASLYVYSALSKCNLMFLEQHGQILFNGLFQSLNLDPARVPESSRPWLIAGFPIGEFLIGLGLVFSRTRRGSAVLAILMHGLLLLTFSSRGLNHEWSVLLWNLFFLLQALILWVLPSLLWNRRQALVDQDVESTRRSRLATGLIMVTIWGFPLLRWSGHLDQWLGWSLYSPRATVVRLIMEVPPEEISQAFPPYTKNAYQWIQGESTPIFFLADRWSLEALHVPLNPEARLEFAVAWSLCERFDCWDDLVVEIETRNLMSPDERETQRYSGREDFSKLANRYRLPVQPNARFLTADERTP